MNIIKKVPILIKDLGMEYPTELSKRKKRFGIFRCPMCNNEFRTEMRKDKTSKATSCKCVSKSNLNMRIKHNEYGTRLYYIWRNMLKRCYNKNTEQYKNYGGRGIEVYTDWRYNFKIFSQWAKGTNYLDTLTLDRIDVNGNYEPDNCRWVSMNTQARNTRDIQINNTSGYRGVYWEKKSKKWKACITINYKQVHIGYYQTAIEAAKAYETYVRLNNLAHNFTPVLSEDEINNLTIKEIK